MVTFILWSSSWLFCDRISTFVSCLTVFNCDTLRGSLPVMPRGCLIFADGLIVDGMVTSRSVCAK